MRGTRRCWCAGRTGRPRRSKRRQGRRSASGLGGYDDVEVPFPRGSLLAAYTDGLVESRTRPVDTGVEMLCSHLSDVDPQDDLETAVDVLLKLMDRGSGHDDDVALVLVRTHDS
jgi:serine phosphatase RsbU (regulator of sigma subunit)